MIGPLGWSTCCHCHRRSGRMIDRRDAVNIGEAPPNVRLDNQSKATKKMMHRTLWVVATVFSRWTRWMSKRTDVQRHRNKVTTTHFHIKCQTCYTRLFTAKETHQSKAWYCVVIFCIYEQRFQFLKAYLINMFCFSFSLIIRITTIHLVDEQKLFLHDAMTLKRRTWK